MATPSPRAIVSTVRTYVRRTGALRAGPLVLAVSGGTDSTALALILAELRDELGLVLHVAHFDHRTRPSSAAGDAQFVAELAARIDAPLRVGRAERAPKSEDEARVMRYAFLRRAAEQLSATAIATGHTRDDQAETVLLHLVRGSGLAGAAGMRPIRDGIARPLLAIGRTETAAMCAAADVTPREDETNTSLRFARNRIRHRVLPELEAVNPQVRAALARFADAAAQTLAPHDEAPASDASVALDALPAARAKRADALALAWRARTGVTLTAAQRGALVELASATAGTRRIDLPGGVALREYGTLHLAPDDPTPPTTGEDDTMRLVARRPSEWHGWRITVGMDADGLPYTAHVDADAARRLAVRSRRPGDRISARRKIQDVFVNAKVPVRARDTWPIVTLDERVLWVPGLTPPPSRGTVLLAAGPVGDDQRPERVTSPRGGRVASKVEARPRGEKRGIP